MRHLSDRIGRLEAGNADRNISVTVSFADPAELAALNDAQWRERYGEQSRSSMVLVRIEE